eukprot:TRINITY_DN6399_c0_g2_i1.p2 TRINITY_DN6399_c0_g2~~TRINITY_DN6399_c0_g2_i1.p2  ORF type:complete len:410 (-),score=99.88 TRINITY_DN6399_c0_g2_i1:1255-2484(-)
MADPAAADASNETAIPSPRPTTFAVAPTNSTTLTQQPTTSAAANFTSHPTVVLKQSSSSSSWFTATGLFWFVVVVLVVLVVLYFSNRRAARFLRKFVISPCKRRVCCGFGSTKHRKLKRSVSGTGSGGGARNSTQKRSPEGVELNYARTRRDEDDYDDDLESENSFGELVDNDSLASPASEVENEVSEEKASHNEEDTLLGRVMQSVSSVNLPKASVGKLKKTASSPIAEDDFQQWIRENARSVRLLSRCLSEEAVIEIQAALPRRYSVGDWELRYSTANDGFSLQTFYANASQGRSTVLVIRDTEGYVFGAFVPERWQISSTQFGNGETFVFSVHPKLQIYPWTRANSFFAVAKSDYIAIGGGKHFAIWVTSGLRQGSSGPCETFNSPKLSGLSEFEIDVIELWAIST